MAEVYNTDRFGELYYASRQPTSDHLLLAATHLARICQNAHIPHAFLGGWTVRLRGGTRETQDVDITVATTTELLKKAMLQISRICFPQTHGQAAVNLFVHTGGSYDQDYKDLSHLAVQVDVIIAGQLNCPTDINSNTSEVIKLPNGFNATVVNTFYLLRGKFHAFITRGQRNTNDYLDLVFLITAYSADMSRRSSDINKAYRLAFFHEYSKTYATKPAFIKWMRETLGLVEADIENEDDDEDDAEDEDEDKNFDWVWDKEHKRYKKLVKGNWQWAPVQQQSSQPESSGAGWVWDETHKRYRRFVEGKWQWASS